MAVSRDPKLEEYDVSDISALIDSIDSLMATSGITMTTDAQTIPLEQIHLDKLRENGFTEAQIDEIDKGMKEGIPVEIYAKKDYNWIQMYEIRQGLLARVNTEIYASPLYSANQMHEIRLGLMDHLDVSSYANLVLSATDMQTVRKTLFSNAYRSNPNQFGRTMTDDETNIAVRISDNCLSAYIKLPNDPERQFSESELLQVLENHEICYGILHDAISKIVKEHIVEREICIAQGKAPIVGKDGWYELFFDNCIEKGHTVPPDGEIDYTDVNTIELATPGDRLAKYHPAQKDTGGVTVTGITVEGTPGEELPHLTGQGFRRDPNTDTYYATTKGYASYNDSTGSLNVWNVYKVQGDVCYYQSIKYDGSVHVAGSVLSMSTIWAKGDIIIDGFLENATLISEQNIVIKGGANGGGQGRIEAGGSVRASFFENIDVVAKGMVESNYYFNANIDTEDRLIARGRKARIIGGRISASLSVDVVIVGNYLSNKTVFNIGDIHTLEKRITSVAMLRKTIMEELEQLNMGKQKLILLLGEEQAEKNDLYKKTCAAIQAKEAHLHDHEREINRLRTVRRRAEQAYIKIHGQLQSDVIFIINNVKKETPTPTDRSVYLTKKDCLRVKKK